MVGGVKKIVENEFYLCCKGGDPRIYENSIFQAYVPEKNKIITPWYKILNVNQINENSYFVFLLCSKSLVFIIVTFMVTYFFTLKFFFFHFPFLIILS